MRRVSKKGGKSPNTQCLMLLRSYLKRLDLSLLAVTAQLTIPFSPKKPRIASVGSGDRHVMRRKWPQRTTGRISHSGVGAPKDCISECSSWENGLLNYYSVVYGVIGQAYRDYGVHQSVRPSLLERKGSIFSARSVRYLLAEDINLLGHKNGHFVLSLCSVGKCGLSF